MPKRFAWFVWVVFTAKNISSKWIDVGFGVTVPASIVIRLSNSFVVTSFSHGNCVGVKFRCGNLSRSPVECCDLGATNIWKKRGTEQNEKNYYIVTFFCVLTTDSGLLLLLLWIFYVDWIIYVCLMTITSVRHFGNFITKIQNYDHKHWSYTNARTNACTQIKFNNVKQVSVFFIVCRFLAYDKCSRISFFFSF